MAVVNGAYLGVVDVLCGKGVLAAVLCEHVEEERVPVEEKGRVAGQRLQGKARGRQVAGPVGVLVDVVVVGLALVGVGEPEGELAALEGAGEIVLANLEKVVIYGCVQLHLVDVRGTRLIGLVDRPAHGAVGRLLHHHGLGGLHAVHLHCGVHVGADAVGEVEPAWGL